MTDKILLIGLYGVIYAAFGAWTSDTEQGRKLRHFLQNWKTDWVHGLLVSISVFILFCCGILALALTLDAIF